MSELVTIDSAGEELNRLHGEIETSMRRTVEQAIRAGEILSKVKDRLAHGEFLPWIRANCSFSRKTADNYRRLYDYSDKMARVANLQEAYRQIETIEKQDRQTEQQRAFRRVEQYRKTGQKPEGWRRGTDDKLYQDQLDYEERMKDRQRRIESESKERQERQKERDEFFKQSSQQSEFLNMAAEAAMANLNKRRQFKERIKVSQSGESDVFIDALMDYLETMDDDNRRIEACQNIIKVCRGIATELQVKQARGE